MEKEVSQETVATEEMFERLVARIKRRKLEQPAVLLLEMHRPLRGIMHAGAAVSLPILAAVCGAGRARALAALLEREDVVDRLIARLTGK